MNREQFKQRMQSLKSYREQNPGKGYWDWKVEQFEEGGDNTPMWLQEPYQGPTYAEIQENVRKENPDLYNQLTENYARVSRPTSEIIQYIDADGNYRTAHNMSAGFVSGTDPVGAAVLDYVVLNKPTNLLFQGVKQAYRNIMPAALTSKKAQKIFQRQIIPRRLQQLDIDFDDLLNSSKNKESLTSLANQIKSKNMQLDFDQDVIPQVYKLLSKSNIDELNPQDATTLIKLFEIQRDKQKLIDFGKNINNFQYVNRPSLLYDGIEDGIEGRYRVTGTYNPSTNIVMKRSNSGEETLIHEFRHRMDRDIPLTNREENVLYEALAKDIHPGEQITTLAELRNNLLKQEGKQNPSKIDRFINRVLNINTIDEQNKVLQSIEPKQLFQALDKVNGYGHDYQLYTTHKDLLEALTKIGAVATPVNILDNYKEGGEIPPDNSPVHVNPFTGKPLANGAITPILNIEDAANFTPAGDVLSIRDAYIAAKNNDLLGLGLAGLGFLPFVPRIGRSKVSKVDRPPVPEVHPDYFQKQMEKAERAAAKRKQTVNDFYTQQDQAYESLIENEDAFRRAVNADASAGTNYTGVYGDYIKNYSRESSRYNDNLTSIRLTDDIPSEAKAQVDPRDLNWIRVNSRYADPDELDPVFQQMNPGLVRHELGHITDEKAGLDYTNKLGDRSKFESESKLKEMFPKTYKRVQDYLLRGSEIKSHMNEFRDYLSAIGQYSPTETAKSLRQKLDKYGSNFKNLKILFDSYKSKSQFARDYNTIPLIGTSALGINYYLNQEEQRRD